jgi:Mce-associated membrane protein
VAVDAAAADGAVRSVPKEAISDDEMATGTTEPAPNQMGSPVRLAVSFGLVALVRLAALGGWLGPKAYESHQAAEQRKLYLQVGRQEAINLTTIDLQHVDGDIRRVLDSATGTLYDDFAKRSQPFVDAVKKARSTSVGVVTEAGLESEARTEARVLVAVTVKSSNAGVVEQEQRAWRMRISVRRVGDDAKVSNVEFVP